MDAEEWVRCRNSKDRDEYIAAAWADLPEATWREILDRFPEMAKWVAHAKRVPLPVLKELAQHPDRAVRFEVASRRKAAPLLALLANDSDEGVRLRVAHNPKCAEEVLLKLEKDDWSVIREAAKRRLAR